MASSVGGKAGAFSKLGDFATDTGDKFSALVVLATALGGGEGLAALITRGTALIARGAALTTGAACLGGGAAAAMLFWSTSIFMAFALTSTS